MAIERKLYMGFQGGMNDSVMPDEMSDQEMRLGLNVELADKIGWVTARGSEKLFAGAASLGSTYTTVFEWLCKGVERLIVSYYNTALSKNVIHQIERATGVSKYLCDGDGSTTFFTHRDNLFMITSDKKIYTVGEYDFASAGVISKVIAVGDVVLNSESTQPAIRKGRFYKSKTAGTKNLVTEDYSIIANWDDVTDILNFTSTIVREMKSATLDFAGQPVTDNNLAPIKACTMMQQHSKSRRFFAAGNPEDPLCLYISEPDMPNYWKTTGVLYPTHSEKKVTAIKQFSEDIVVSYRNVWYRWNGLDFDDMVWKPLNLNHGAVGNGAVVMTEYSMTYWSWNGIKTVSASILSSEAALLQGEKVISDLSGERIENVLKAAINPSTVKAVYHDGNVLFAFATNPEKPSERNFVLNLDFGKRAFTTHDTWKIYDLMVDINGKFIIASQNYLLECLTGRSDLDPTTGLAKAIPWRVRTKSYNLSKVMATKEVLFAYLLLKQFPFEPSTFNLKLIFDSSKEIEFIGIEGSESFVWGNNWGASYGFSEYLEKMIEVKEFCSTITVELSGESMNSAVGLYAVGFEYVQLPLKSIIHRKAGA